MGWLDFVQMMNDASAKASKLQASLAECYRLSGADPDGNEDWRLAETAVDEVRRMRAEFDKMQGEHVELVDGLNIIEAFINNQINGGPEPIQPDPIALARVMLKAKELLAKVKA